MTALTRRARLIELAVKRDIAVDILAGESAKEVDRQRYNRVDGVLMALDWESGTMVPYDGEIIPFRGRS